jgi:hypothetical protein
MPSRNVAYAILGVAPLRYIDLIAAEAHNLRTIPVVGIDPAAKANPPMPRGNGLSLPNEVMRRIRESGAKEPARNDNHTSGVTTITHPWSGEACGLT